MREIKFRSYELGKGPMVYSDFFAYSIGFGGWTKTEQNGTILMQYTGLKDKNGKDIFEGDILKWKDCDDYEGVSKVVWNVGGCNFEMKPNHGGYDYEPTLGSCFESGEMEVEVLGNIYEHGHILNAQS